MNKKVCKTLEFDKIIDMLVNEADSALGKDSARRLRPLSDREEITALQAETTHALTRIFHHGPLSFHGLTGTPFQRRYAGSQRAASDRRPSGCGGKGRKI